MVAGDPESPIDSDRSGSFEVSFSTPTMSERIDDALVRLDGVRNLSGVAAIGVAVTVAAIALAVWFGRSAPLSPVDERIPQVRLATTLPVGASDDGVRSLVVVHVSGAVIEPGVVSLPTTARVLDAVDAAGGPTGEADLHQLNLAAPLVDGVRIHVPAIGEEVSIAGTDLVTGPVADDPGGPVDINRATAAELERLNGVGPSIAAAIIGHREENGPFVALEDLLAVPGIGQAKLATIGDGAVVR